MYIHTYMHAYIHACITYTYRDVRIPDFTNTLKVTKYCFKICLNSSQKQSRICSGNSSLFLAYYRIGTTRLTDSNTIRQKCWCWPDTARIGVVLHTNMDVSYTSYS